MCGCNKNRAAPVFPSVLPMPTRTSHPTVQSTSHPTVHPTSHPTVRANVGPKVPHPGAKSANVNRNVNHGHFLQRAQRLFSTILPSVASRSVVRPRPAAAVAAIKATLPARLAALHTPPVQLPVQPSQTARIAKTAKPALVATRNPTILQDQSVLPTRGGVPKANPAVPRTAVAPSGALLPPLQKPSNPISISAKQTASHPFPSQPQRRMLWRSAQPKTKRQ